MGEIWSDRQGARMLRLAIVRNLRSQGLLDEAFAVELLQGCLTPGDESTRVDDSGLLNATLEQAIEMTKDEG